MWSKRDNKRIWISAADISLRSLYVANYSCQMQSSGCVNDALGVRDSVLRRWIDIALFSGRNSSSRWFRCVVTSGEYGSLFLLHTRASQQNYRPHRAVNYPEEKKGKIITSTVPYGWEPMFPRRQSCPVCWPPRQARAIRIELEFHRVGRREKDWLVVKC